MKWSGALQQIGLKSLSDANKSLVVGSFTPVKSDAVESLLLLLFGLFAVHCKSLLASQ